MDKIDLVAPPSQVDGLRKIKHTTLGHRDWDPKRFKLWKSDFQSTLGEDDPPLSYDEILQEVSRHKKKPCNANLLDWLLKNPQVVSAIWRGTHVLFLETVFYDSHHRRIVRSLKIDGGKLSPDIYWVGDGFNKSHSIVVMEDI